MVVENTVTIIVVASTVILYLFVTVTLSTRTDVLVAIKQRWGEGAVKRGALCGTLFLH